MPGAIVSDIVGSVYEFDNHKSKDFPLFREDSTFTDDTILTIATADALMCWDWDFAAKYREYGKRYPSSYGNRFRDWIDDDLVGIGRGTPTNPKGVPLLSRHGREFKHAKSSPML